MRARFEAAARARQLDLTKPPGSLGRLEDLACWFASRLSDVAPSMPRAEIFVFAADHGVAAHGISAFPQAVTAQMVRNFAAGGAAINVLASLAGCRMEIVDVGIAWDMPALAGVRNERVRRGTWDLSQGDAMTIPDLQAAMAVGERCAREAAERGTRLLIAGDMGIANTTAAACLICAFTGAEASKVVGRGTGIDEEALARKVAIVEASVSRAHEGRAPSPMQLLARLGGLEIAAMTGAYIEAARQSITVLLDGYISGAAALAAAHIQPAARDWMIAAHRSAEPGHSIALQKLGLAPLLDLGLRLGEGTGAALALPLIRAALALHAGMATFADASVSHGT